MREMRRVTWQGRHMSCVENGHNFFNMELSVMAGYMVSRMLGAAPVLADAIVEQLCAASDAAAQSHRPLGAETEADAERLSAAIWHSIWPVERCACSPVVTMVKNGDCLALPLGCGEVCMYTVCILV